MALPQCFLEYIYTFFLSSFKECQVRDATILTTSLQSFILRRRNHLNQIRPAYINILICQRKKMVGELVRFLFLFIQRTPPNCLYITQNSSVESIGYIYIHICQYMGHCPTVYGMVNGGWTGRENIGWGPTVLKSRSIICT